MGAACAAVMLLSGVQARGSEFVMTELLSLKDHSQDSHNYSSGRPSQRRSHLTRWGRLVRWRQ